MSLPFMLATGLGLEQSPWLSPLWLRRLSSTLRRWSAAARQALGDVQDERLEPSAAGDQCFGSSRFYCFRRATHPVPRPVFLVASGDLLQDARNPLFVLLSGLDLFWLWHLLLTVVGLQCGSFLAGASRWC